MSSSAFSSVSSVHDLGWSPAWADAVTAADVAPGTRPARVVHQAASSWQVHDGVALVHARARSRSLDPRPVTGDWVMVTDDDLIASVLPRSVTLSRAEAGGRSVPQVIAANVDVVGICAAADQVNERRIERELTAVWSSGAMPVVVVTKVDATADSGRAVASVATVAVGAQVVAASSVTGEGVGEVRALVAQGGTIALIGPSGVGKSTLVNALVGEVVMSTSDVRADGKGRHTTTARQLVPLPGGGVILDTPGMREFAPWAGEDDLAMAFADIDELAGGCRFADCAHDVEPGCAVRAAADADPSVAARLDSWRRLQRELAWLARRHDARAMAEERRRWAAITKSVRGQVRP